MKRLLLLLLALAGCVNPLDSLDLTRTHVPFDPPDYYLEWYAEIVADVRASGGRQFAPTPFSDIQWIAVLPEGHLHEWYSANHGYSTCGLYLGRTVHLCMALIGTERLVKHEMLHAVLRRGDHAHPLFAEYDRIQRVESLPQWAWDLLPR